MSRSFRRSLRIINKISGSYRIAKTAVSFSNPQELSYLHRQTIRSYYPIIPIQSDPSSLTLPDPGQMNTVLLRKFPGHILKSKIKPISARKLLNNAPTSQEKDIKYLVTILIWCFSDKIYPSIDIYYPNQHHNS